MAFIAGLLVVAFAMPALALDPSRAIEQFGRTSWSLKDGAPTNVMALAQTGDGYLWIGARKGLYRFDGMTFERLPAFHSTPSRSDSITALLAARNGDLWVGHLWGGISVFREGRMQDMNPAPPNGVVYRIVQTGDGAIWTATSGIRRVGLRRYKDGKWEIINAGERGLPFTDLGDILAADDGSLWVALVDRIVRLPPGGVDFEPIADPVRKASALSQDSDGRIWIVDADGVRALTGAPGPIDARPQEGVRAENNTAFLRDRHNVMWAANRNLGVMRIRDPAAFARGLPDAADKAKPESTLPAGIANALLEDREGNIWIGTNRGLERIRDVSIVSHAHSASSAGLGSPHIRVIPAEGGDFYAMWGHGYEGWGFGDSPRLQFNRGGAWTDLSDVVERPMGACAAPGGRLWITEHKGLRLLEAGRATAFFPWPDILESHNVEQCREDSAGRIWVSGYRVGLVRFDGKEWSRFDVSDELKGIWPYVWNVDSQGRFLMYYGTRSLFRIDGDKVETLLDKSAIDVGLIGMAYSVGDRIYLGGEGGLMIGDGSGFRTLSAERYPFLAHVAGVAQTAAGEVWIVSAAGLVRISKADLDRALAQPGAPIAARVFDFHDGLEGEAQGNYENDAVEGSDGRIWFATTNALSWVDPRHLARNDNVPTVLLRSIAANGHAVAIEAETKLAADIHQLQIAYTATSLTAPERVRFRYRLAGVDDDWVDAGGRREAIYTNLRPGTYRFEVMAANDDGIWSSGVASVQVRVPPTFLQSNAFLALCAAAIACLLAFVYRLRMRQVSERLRLGHEARTAERERIARELHDTLLQSVQGLIYRFQSVAAQIPPSQAARPQMEAALDRADSVVAEARDRVVQLRRPDRGGSLPDVLAAAAERILAGSDIEVRVVVEGAVRDVTASVGEELTSIAGEFLFNTLQHANARQVEIVLVFGRRAFGLHLRDDGRGLDTETLDRGGRDGHFGLPGMRERAMRLGAEFTLQSQPGVGVDIILKVPAAVAYPRRRRGVPAPEQNLNAASG